jgi:hypothetical protein
MPTVHSKVGMLTVLEVMAMLRAMLALGMAKVVVVGQAQTVLLLIGARMDRVRILMRMDRQGIGSLMVVVRIPMHVKR